MICLAVSTEYWHVTDRPTDRQTDIFRQHSLCIASCGKNETVTVKLYYLTYKSLKKLLLLNDMQHWEWANIL